MTYVLKYFFLPPDALVNIISPCTFFLKKENVNEYKLLLDKRHHSAWRYCKSPDWSLNIHVSVCLCVCRERVYFITLKTQTGKYIILRIESITEFVLIKIKVQLTLWGFIKVKMPEKFSQSISLRRNLEHTIH